MLVLQKIAGKSVLIFGAALVLSGCTIAQLVENIPVLNQVLPTTDSIFLAGDDSTRFIEDQEVENIEVIYTDFGFEPQNLEIEPNTRVVFLNQTADKMWIKSDQPIYNLKPIIDQKDGARAGEWYSVVFLKQGTWKYLNHLNPDKKGTITVQ
jgi:plastocyanin